MDAIRTSIGPKLFLFFALVQTGCHSAPTAPDGPIADLPRELVKISLPDYRVEPPDVLLIEVVRAIPKPPYRAEPLDVLLVQLADPIPGWPLYGPVSIEPDGTINLGATYGGSVKVVGLTIPEIKAAIEKHLAEVVKLKLPQITVSLAQARAAQRISGPHLVRQDGTISLGTYGSVRVAGMTLADVRRAIEAHASTFLLNPEISVDVGAYNSKLYYVIQDGGGVGQTVTRLPITGNDTVLDAVAQLGGLAGVASKERIWVSRPAPSGCAHQILPVNWRAITEDGDTATNYQLMPGDRIFVASYPLVRLDNAMARMIAPVERAFGIILLGNSTVRALQQTNTTTTTTTTSAVP